MIPTWLRQDLIHYAKAAAYAATGYILTHSLTNLHDWRAAALAAATAVISLIHSELAPDTPNE